MTKPADSQPSPPSPEDWENLQHNYWNAWLSLMQNMTKMAAQSSAASAPEIPNSMTHWSESLELWWEALASSLTPENHEVLRKFIDQGKSYFRLNGEFLKAFQSLQNSDPNSAEWQHLWDVGFEELKTSFVNARTKQNETFGFWEMPLDNWQRTLSSLSTMPNDFLENFKDEVVHSERKRLSSKMEQLLSMPGIGYTREWQEQFQNGARLWLKYQNAQQDYSAQFQKIGLRTIELLRKRMLQLQQQNETVNDLRSLYNIWVDCGEEAYAEHVKTAEFITIHARLINSLMAWKRHEQKVIDTVLSALHMPTRKELDTMNLRIHQLRRENKLLQNDPNNAHMFGLIQEVNTLRAEVNELRDQVLKEPRLKPSEPPAASMASSTRRKPTRRRNATPPSAPDSSTHGE